MTNRTAKRLDDPMLSNRAFAIFFIVTILIVIGLLLAPKAHAATRTFDGGPSGTGTDLLNAANWSLDTAPTTSDEALFSTVPAGPATLTLTTASATYGDLIWNQNNSSSITI